MDSLKIKICLGGNSHRKMTPGLGVYGEVAHLQNVEISVNREKTWLATFQDNFGMSLNPDAYYIQRHQSSKTKLKFSHRSLTEQIGEWLGKDFKNKKAFYNVHLFKNRDIRTNISTITSKTKREKFVPKTVENDSTSSTQKAKGLGALYTFKSAEVEMGGILAPELEPLHEQSFRVKDPLMTWLDVFSKHFGIHLDPERYFARHHVSKSLATIKEHDLRESVQHLIQDFPKIYPNKANTILIVERASRPKSSTMEGSGITALGNSFPNTRAKRIIKRKLPFDESEDRSPKVKQTCNRRKGQGNDEPRPGPSSQIQKRPRKVKAENQEEPHEDIKEKVLCNLTSKFTNSQLLKARAEILGLKEKSQRLGARDLWSDWNTSCPLPAAILRDLFDV